MQWVDFSSPNWCWRRLFGGRLHQGSGGWCGGFRLGDPHGSLDLWQTLMHATLTQKYSAWRVEYFVYYIQNTIQFIQPVQ
jgi:hypothetical protein